MRKSFVQVCIFDKFDGFCIDGDILLSRLDCSACMQVYTTQLLIVVIVCYNCQLRLTLYINDVG